jgi:hypothetical protein
VTNQEYDALLANNTWTLCPLPANHHLIRNKWVYKVKQKVDGSIECHKTRLVAKGFDQRCGIDYIETFSPVTKPATVMLVLAIPVHFNWPICQLDISDAFLHGNLQEDVYMAQPQCLQILLLVTNGIKGSANFYHCPSFTSV